MHIDPYTFGSDKTYIKLAELIKENDSKIKKSVGKLFSRYCRGISEIGWINDKSIRDLLFQVWKNYYTQKIEKIKMPTIIESYLRNIMKAKITDIKKEIEEDSYENT